jgi:hypothetical protein
VAAGSSFSERFLFARDFQRLSGRVLTDGDLADLLGFKSQGEITTYKARTTPPHAERVLIVALQCGVDPGWLAFGEDSQAPRPPGFEQWLENRRKAPQASTPKLEPSPMVRARQQPQRRDAKKPAPKKKASGDR